MPKLPEIYFSFDVEANGRPPGTYSMLALGMSACATFDGKNFKTLDLDSPENEFLLGLQPINDNVITEADEVCQAGGFGTEEMKISGTPPRAGMQRAWDWIEKRSKGYRPVAVAYPLGFDWGFIDYYFLTYAVNNPFGFSGALDIKSQYQGKTNAMIGNCTKRNMPNRLLSKRKHTHNPLDDAKEQAELFVNIWKMNDR